MSKKNQIIKLLHAGLSYSQITEQVGCSKSTVSYHARNERLDKPETCAPADYESRGYKISREHGKKVLFHCLWCGKLLPKRKKYCNQECHVEHKISSGIFERAKANGYYVTKWRQRTKLRAIEYKGGKCQACGYSKSVRAMHFHHVDPSTKSFGLSSKGLCRKWSDVKSELDKCVLLCSNCHCEVHDGILTL